MPVGVAQEEGVGSAVVDGHARRREPGLQAGRSLTVKASTCPEPASAPVPRRWRSSISTSGARVEPHRTQPPVRLREPPLLGEPEQPRIEPSRPLHVGDAEGQVVDGSDRLAFGHALLDVDRLHVHELADAEARQLAAVARLLDPAEGQARVGLHEGVHEAGARLDLLARPGARPGPRRG